VGNGETFGEGNTIAVAGFEVHPVEVSLTITLYVFGTSPAN
jgi:hypothetical protein